MAGEEFAAQVIRDCYEKQKAEVAAAINVISVGGKEIKTEPGEVKPEIIDTEVKVKEILPFNDEDLISRPYAFAQNAFKRQLKQRQNLISNAIGLHSRALCARQDLKIRRILCGLPEEELVREAAVVPLVAPLEVEEEEGEAATAAAIPQVKPQSSIELAFQMFKRATERVC